MSSFQNTFAVLKEINDKKKTFVISDKPRAKKPKAEKTEKAAAAPAAAPVKAAAVPAKAAAAKKAAPAFVANEAPKNSLQAAKETLKRQQAEAAAKAAEPVPEPVAEPVVEAVAEPVAEGEVAAEGEAVAAAGEKPVPEAPKLTLEEYNKLQEQKRFTVGPKVARRVDPNAKVEGFVVLKDEPVKKAAPVKPAAAPVKVAPKTAVKGAKAAPAPAPAQKTAPKEKKEKVISLGEFAASVEESARGRGRGGYRGGFRGGYGGRAQAAPVNVEDKKLFPSL